MPSLTAGLRSNTSTKFARNQCFFCFASTNSRPRAATLKPDPDTRARRKSHVPGASHPSHAPITPPRLSSHFSQAPVTQTRRIIWFAPRTSKESRSGSLRLCQTILPRNTGCSAQSAGFNTHRCLRPCPLFGGIMNWRWRSISASCAECTQRILWSSQGPKGSCSSRRCGIRKWDPNARKSVCVRSKRFVFAAALLDATKDRKKCVMRWSGRRSLHILEAPCTERFVCWAGSGRLQSGVFSPGVECRLFPHILNRESGQGREKGRKHTQVKNRNFRTSAVKILPS